MSDDKFRVLTGYPFSCCLLRLECFPMACRATVFLQLRSIGTLSQVVTWVRIPSGMPYQVNNLQAYKGVEVNPVTLW